MLIQRVFVLVATVSSVMLLSSWGWQVPAQAAQDEGSRGGGSGDVTLRIAGDQGTHLSGTCSVGGEERDISGQVPQSFEFDLEGQKLECELRKQGDKSSELKVVLISEYGRSVQRVEGEDVTLRLTYAKGNVSSSTTSVSSSSSSSQTVISSNGSSSSGANGDARGGGDDAQRRAERIIERVFKEVGLDN